MAAKEMWDYLPSATAPGDNADYTATELSISSHVELVATGKKPQVDHELDDGNVETQTRSNQSFFTVPIQWTWLTATDAGTIMDFYHDSSKANGKARSFYWQHPDGHTYKVKFASELLIGYKAGWATNKFIPPIILRIIGRKP